MTTEKKISLYRVFAEANTEKAEDRIACLGEAQTYGDALSLVKNFADILDEIEESHEYEKLNNFGYHIRNRSQFYQLFSSVEFLIEECKEDGQWEGTKLFVDEVESLQISSNN